MSFLINPYGFADNGIPEGNIILYLDCENDVVDQTGNFTVTNNGISFNNASPKSGVWYANYNLGTDNLVIPNNSLINFGDGSTDSAFSFGFWIKVDDNWASNPRVVDKRSSSGTNKEFRLVFLSGVPRFVLNDESSGGAIFVDGTTTLSDATWYFLTFTYDGSSANTGLEIYVNAVNDTGTRTTSGTYTAMEDLGENIIIGKDATGTFNTVSGDLDSIQFYDKELSSAEVSAIYNKLNSGNEIL